VGIISATNKDLEKEVGAGRFRKDLYYRLTGVEIRLPPLRERKEDIPPLVYHFLELFTQKGGGKVRGVSKEAMELLINYDWPGNVRQLKNEVERAAILATAKDSWITPEQLSEGISAEETRLSEGTFSFNPEEAPRKVVDRLERQITESVLRKCSGNKTKAAKLLGITRMGLIKRLKRYQTSNV
jgi:DNA-binding NtrC family response regulator